MGTLHEFLEDPRRPGVPRSTTPSALPPEDYAALFSAPVAASS